MSETINSNYESIHIDPTEELILYNKNIINSRLEKFLYAICSLDVSDLPVPISRIEELYNCLATNAAIPSFEPQSRVEQFLMAILGNYDLNSLPKPQSRSEVLLNKIATGDDNLQDIEFLRSKYEFLLAYIIKTGGIGNFEIETVLLMIENGEMLVDENGEEIELEKIRTKI